MLGKRLIAPCIAEDMSKFHWIQMSFDWFLFFVFFVNLEVMYYYGPVWCHSTSLVEHLFMASATQAALLVEWKLFCKLFSMVDKRNEITMMSFSFFLNFSPLSNFFFFLIRSVLHSLLNFLSSY